jgi:uncharacterized protein
MNIYARIIENQIKNDLFKQKAIIIYGPRQVGKTTLVKQIMQSINEKSIYLNCDEIDVRQSLEGKTSTQLKGMIGDAKIVVLNEAQRVESIGIVIKLLVDKYEDIQVIATGSSSFDLASGTRESLTGRYFEYNLYPLSEQELVSKEDNQDLIRRLEEKMLYGTYPDVYTQANFADKIRALSLITNSYLFKDILNLANIRGSNTLYDLLQLLALQIGNEVSYSELANKLEIDKETVKRYIDLLEKTFVVFRLRAFSRNIRNEINKNVKVYFYDLGIRNSLINNFNSLDKRTDKGGMFENYVITERIKYNSYQQNLVNCYFWRTYNMQEIDYIEESGGLLSPVEIKWSKSKVKTPKSFVESYNTAELKVINHDNYLEFVKD